MKTGERFSFIVEQKIAERMDRVVMINDGRVKTKEAGTEGVVYEVERT
jgi:hypothetical protein